MRRIALLSDTHAYLDKQVIDYLQDCDEIWHAGDVGNIQVWDALTAIKPCKGVFGNIDGSPVRGDLPETLHFYCQGVKVMMTHIGGYPGNYPDEISQALRVHKPNLFICGHSHILKVMRDDKQFNLLHMNPGAAGKEGIHTERTLLRFSITGNTIHDLEIVQMPKTTLVA